MLKRVSTVLLVVSLVGVLGVLGFSQKKVTVAVLWSGAELEAFEKTLAPFEAETGIDVVVESVGRDLPAVLVTRLAAGNPPDVAAMPNPGQMKEFADQGVLVALDGIVDLSDSSKAFVDLGSVDNHVYGLFISADLKSLVWYNPKAFAAKGYEVPTSWAELIDLCNRIVADGGTPWALGMESGAASGWVGTDWIEDIMLRTAGPDLYDKWVNHEISWTHPAVKKAFEYFGQIVNEPGYIYGGATGALTINFGDSPNALFTDPPGAYMHRQATFIQSFIRKANPDLVAGEDYDVFPPGVIHGYQSFSYKRYLYSVGEFIDEQVISYLEGWLHRTGRYLECLNDKGPDEKSYEYGYYYCFRIFSNHAFPVFAHA